MVYSQRFRQEFTNRIKKERRYSKHGFMHGEHVFVINSFEQFD